MKQGANSRRVNTVSARTRDMFVMSSQVHVMSARLRVTEMPGSELASLRSELMRLIN